MLVDVKPETTALHCTGIFILFFLSLFFGDMDRVPPQSPTLPKSKPGSRGGHDIETPTGLGTHKSARACYEPTYLRSKEPAPAQV